MTHSSSSRLGSSDFSSQSKPEHLIEKKTEIAEDGSVREIRHEVTSAPGKSYIHTQSVYFETNHDSDLIEACLHTFAIFVQKGPQFIEDYILYYTYTNEIS